jgi:hypothetical protein
MTTGASAATPDASQIRTGIEAARESLGARRWPAAALPLVFIIALAALGTLPSVWRSAHLLWSFLAAVAALGVWYAVLMTSASRRGRTLTATLDIRPQHYLQACAQGSVLLYWGWYWREVYESAHLLAAQLLFAYAFDMLLSWSRRDSYRLGFSVFPVIFSINLFLWFKPEWFFLQFLMIAAGFAAKKLIRWDKDGRRVHIFNPSALPLAAFSLVLLITGTTDLTWGQEIAITLNRPFHIYAMIFLIGLPGQLLFGVSSVTMAAVVTMYAFSLAYFAATGTYYFIDAHIPIAVFLGMHLLLPDPSTSPRSELGRIIFGVCYAISIVALYALLGRIGAPTFYDKLLAVPIMNVTIKSIDRLVRSGALKWIDPARLASQVTGRRRYFGYVAIWAVIFVAMNTTEVVGDSHRGRWIPFWQQACAQGRPNGCRQLGVLVSTYCRIGSGWACNEYALLLQPQLRPELAANAFRRACDLGFAAGCTNLESAGLEDPVRAPPEVADYAIVLREGKAAVKERSALQLYEKACRQGFPDGCEHAHGPAAFGSPAHGRLELGPDSAGTKVLP